MSSSQATTLAKHGLSFLLNATSAGVEAISGGITKVRRKYADHQAKEQLEALKKSGKSAQDILFLVFQRFYYLSLAGYKNELSAAAGKAANRLIDSEYSTLPLDGVLDLGSSLLSSAFRYGDFGKTTNWQNLQDYLNSSRMGKDHFDRDQLANDLYFSILYLSEAYGGMSLEFQDVVKRVAVRMIESATNSSSSSHVSPIFNSNMTLPDYATVSIPSTSPVPSIEEDNQIKAAKTIYILASTIKKAADEADIKRQKSIRDAEDMLRRERESAARFKY